MIVYTYSYTRAILFPCSSCGFYCNITIIREYIASKGLGGGGNNGIGEFPVMDRTQYLCIGLPLQ